MRYALVTVKSSVRTPTAPPLTKARPARRAGALNGILTISFFSLPRDTLLFPALPFSVLPFAALRCPGLAWLALPSAAQCCAAPSENPFFSPAEGGVSYRIVVP